MNKLTPGRLMNGSLPLVMLLTIFLALSYKLPTMPHWANEAFKIYLAAAIGYHVRWWLFRQTNFKPE